MRPTHRASEEEEIIERRPEFTEREIGQLYRKDIRVAVRETRRTGGLEAHADDLWGPHQRRIVWLRDGRTWAADQSRRSTVDREGGDDTKPSRRAIWIPTV